VDPHQETSKIISKKTPTKERLLYSALELFSAHWYETVSVAEICRNAGLSNGIFYRYFKGKEDTFKELLEMYLEKIRECLKRIEGESAEERLDNFFEAVYSFGSTYKDLLSVYREGQYRFPAYEKRLRDIYTEAASRAWGRLLGEAEYIYTCSGIRFVTIRSLFNRLIMDTKLLRNAVMSGIFPEKLREGRRIFPDTVEELKPEEESSQNRLIEAGIRLFGKKGYYNINVYEIAKEAGFSVGTFYLYFPTKEDFLADIVRLIGHRTRMFISLNLDHSLNRLEQELQGMYLFLLYFKTNREYYRIVREAEFVVSDEVNNYYNAFEAGYLKDLDRIKYPGAKSKKVLANALLGISHYFGIEVLYSGNITEEKSVILEFGTLMSEGMK
jgi:AcrR family transcriptional regulator